MGLHLFVWYETAPEQLSDEFLGTTQAKINMASKKDTIEIFTVKDYNMKAVYNFADTGSVFDYSVLSGKENKKIEREYQ